MTANYYIAPKPIIHYRGTHSTGIASFNSCKLSPKLIILIAGHIQRIQLMQVLPVSHIA